MNKSELINLEEILVRIAESNYNIRQMDKLYEWAIDRYRSEGKKRLGSHFKDDI